MYIARQFFVVDYFIVVCLNRVSQLYEKERKASTDCHLMQLFIASASPLRGNTTVKICALS